MQREEDDHVRLIRDIFFRSKKKFGWRRIRMEAEKDGIIINHKKIQRIMREEGLGTRIRRRNPYRDIMKKGLEHRTAPNILNRKFV